MEQKDASDEGPGKDFLPKIKRVAAKVPGVSDVLALAFYLRAGTAPIKHKLSILATLAYFVMPLDAIPDFLGPIGYTDDLAAALGLITFIGSEIMDPYRKFAKGWLLGTHTSENLDEAVRGMNEKGESK